MRGVSCLFMLQVDQSNIVEGMATGTGSLKTIVILGSVREGRMGLRVARFIMKQLEAANHVVELFGKDENTFRNAECGMATTYTLRNI